MLEIQRYIAKKSLAQLQEEFAESVNCYIEFLEELSEVAAENLR